MEYEEHFEAAEESEAQVLKELDSPKRLIQELILCSEKTLTEEVKAKLDLELAQLMTEEEQGIADEVCVVAKAQLELSRARFAAAVAELKSVKELLVAMQAQAEYDSLLREKDMGIIRVEEAVCSSKDVLETFEALTLELITAREYVESAHASHKEAEEEKIGALLARGQDAFIWEMELKQALEEMQRLEEQLLLARELKSKLDSASNLLLELQGELAAYMEAMLYEEFRSNGEGNIIDETGEAKEIYTYKQKSIDAIKELEDVKIDLEKVKREVNCLRIAAISIKPQLEDGKATLASLRQREGIASMIISSLQAELDRTKSEVKHAQEKENEAREKMVELPKALQQAAKEADEAKSVAQLAREEVQKAREEAIQAKASASTIQNRFHAVVKEIEALTVSHTLAFAAVQALQENEQAARVGFEDSLGGVILPLDKYYALSKRAHKAEESADERVASALSQMEVAKESELRSLEKLGAVHRELAERQEAVRAATKMADKAEEEKLLAEQQLRMWRSVHELQRIDGHAPQGASTPLRNPARSFEVHTEQAISGQERVAPVPMIYVPENDTENSRSGSKARKKSLFPRLVSFMARKRAQPWK